jgi:hypothetical protein
MRDPILRTIGATVLAATLIMITSISIAPSFGGIANHTAEAQIPNEDSNDDTNNEQRITNSSVIGRYSYQDEVIVTFPKDWSGFEVTENNESTLVVAVGPEDLSTLNELQDADPAIFLVVSKRASVDMAPGLDPPLISVGNNGSSLDCELQSSKIILLNSIFSEELQSLCELSTSENTNSDHAMTTLHSILTRTDDKWVALMLYGTPQGVQVSRPEFDKTLATLTVAGALEINIPFGVSSITGYNVNVNSSIVPVDLITSSNITDFTLDEGDKTILFKAEGRPGTQGITQLSIGRVLEGPYIVTVNGEIWNDYDVLNQEFPREEKIQIRYEHGISQIVVKGTQVVPEFPSGGIIGIAAGLTIGSTIAFGLARSRRITR